VIGVVALGAIACGTPPMTGEAPPRQEQLCLEPDQVRLPTGRAITLIAKSCDGVPLRYPLIWESSDDGVATVMGTSNRGVVTGLFPGRARIRVTDAEGRTATVTARVGG
jgi:hypothetical protein